MINHYKCHQIQSQRVLISWGGMPPDPLSIGMLHMPMCFTHYDSAYPSCPHINNDDTAGCTPLFKSLDPPLIMYVESHYVYFKRRCFNINFYDTCDILFHEASIVS